MTKEELQAELQKAIADKRELSAIVDPLREARDAVVRRIAPLEAEAAQYAEKIKAHMPAMALIDQRMSALAKQLGHPRVGGLPELFGR